jgi:hypothetical protein
VLEYHIDIGYRLLTEVNYFLAAAGSMLEQTMNCGVKLQGVLILLLIISEKTHLKNKKVSENRLSQPESNNVILTQ